MNNDADVNKVGKAFGIIAISFADGPGIDLSLPRIDSKAEQEDEEDGEEKKTGKGHKGITVKADPFMSIKEAARRRDFTMNTLAADPLTAELYDYFGGLEDIKNRLIRVTDEERFKDDPLRAMRAMQFVGRFGMKVDPGSLGIIREMGERLKELPRERIGMEWKKLLLKSEKPSLGLSAGMSMGIFNELHLILPALSKTEQDNEWHPEGDVWAHTMMVVDEAAYIVRHNQIDEEQSYIIMLAALCHDFGKPLTTELDEDTGRITSRGHEPAGEDPTEKFLAELGMSSVKKKKTDDLEGQQLDKEDNETGDKRKGNKKAPLVINLVKNHLVPAMFYIKGVIKGEKITDTAVRRLAKRIFPATIQQLCLVAEADHRGRGPFPDPKVPEQLLIPFNEFPAGEWLLKRARDLNIEDSKPKSFTQGREWKVLGYKEGPNIGELIKLSTRLHYEKGWNREEIFAQVYGISDPEKAIAKLNSFFLNK
jgi:tRNA nucleotidyltransferase (CCA-adding enzyme)